MEGGNTNGFGGAAPASPQRPPSPPPPPPLESGVPPPPPPDMNPPAPPPDMNPPAPPPDMNPPGLPVETKRQKQGWGTKKSSGQAKNADEILRAKKERDDAASKPKFLSKKERERIALEKRAAEVAAAQKPKDDRMKFGETKAAGSSIARYNNAKHDDMIQDSRSSGERAPTGPRAMRDNYDERSRNDRMLPSPPPASGKEKRGSKAEKCLAEEDETVAQAKMVRQYYLGSEQTSNFSVKKRKRGAADKFNFAWSADEDTSRDYNPLYQHKHEANFFGRGRLAGFGDDVVDQQAQRYARALETRDHESGEMRAKEVLEMERRRREEDKRTQIDKHWSQKALKDMRERDWRIFKEDFEISTKGGSVPNPMRSWAESGLSNRVLELVEQVGYKDPTPIQRAAIPTALESRDLIGVAQTGSGKTAAFILPLLMYIMTLPRFTEEPWRIAEGPYAIVLAPTRELAQQIESETMKFTGPLGFKVVSIVGGHSIDEQNYNLRNGAEIIIATPGRLVDFLERRMLVLNQCCYVIMDEADRMIDMGFEDPVNKILDALPVTNEKPDTDEAENSLAMRRYRYRQTMMYTATMPAAVERIARKYLRRPAVISVGNVGEAVDTVEQHVELITGEEKRKKRLAEILGSRTFRPPIIVFVNIKRNCDAVARDIRHMGFSAVTLHGSKTQEQREAALAALRNGQAEILVATDLAGRGIDVPDVSLVINFNMASSIETYTHRIGRTGRAGKSGVAITFLGNEDADVMYDLKQMLAKSPISRVPDELRRHEAAQSKPTRGHGKKIEDSSGAGGKGGWP